MWPCPLTTPMTLTWSLKVKVWNSLISGMGGLIDMVWKGCAPSIYDHDIDFCVTIVVWVELPDSDWGYFRCWHAIDICSFKYKILGGIEAINCDKICQGACGPTANIMPQSHLTTGPVPVLAPVRFLARKAEWSTHRNFKMVFFSWSHQATSSFFFMPYGPHTGPVQDLQGCCTAPLWTRKAIDTTRICKNLARASYVAVHGLFMTSKTVRGP